MGLGRIGNRKVNSQAVPEAVRTRYAEVIKTLALRPAPAEPDLLGLTPQASALFDAFRYELEPRRDAETGDLASIVEWSSKLDGQTLRIAALLQLAMGAEGEMPDNIDAEAMAAAISLAHYFIEHSKVAHRMMRPGDATRRGPAERLLRWAQQADSRVFTVREAHQALRGGTRFEKVEAVEAALTILQITGWVRPEDDVRRDGPGRPPSPRWRVHPAAFGTDADR